MTARDYPLCPTYPSMPHNKWFINEACSVKIVGYYPRSFCLFIDLDNVTVHKHAKKKTKQNKTKKQKKKQMASIQPCEHHVW